MENQEQIERYLEGEMTAEEQAAFAARMAGDSELALEVRMHLRVDSALGNRKEMEVEALWKQVMAEPHEESSPEEEESAADPPKAIPLWRRPLPMVGGIAALLVLGILLWTFLNQKASPQELFAEHYVAYDGSGEIRGEEGIPPNLLSAAFDGYNAGHFADALIQFEQILDLDPNNARAHFYLGICHLETGDAEAGLKAFEAVIREGENLFMDQAAWYAGMCCLKIEDPECVRKHLSPLSDTRGKYQGPTQKILKALPPKGE